jgi:hypothetical protein
MSQLEAASGYPAGGAKPFQLLRLKRSCRELFSVIWLSYPPDAFCYSSSRGLYLFAELRARVQRILFSKFSHLPYCAEIVQGVKLAGIT